MGASIPLAAQCLANHGTYRQIWNVMVVHNIKMHHVGAGCDHSFDVFTQLCKVSRKNRWCDKVLFHGLDSSLV
ncbi:MAG: hypothetical protein Ct9H300mP14_01060 [Gammaproteobacteria bacterium]|nr:MAG: hypothetical protein Ct9H300mP14_01060 [Gammaproteobacteria bacterium]